MKWRKWNIIVHRDLGYLCVGLTLVYAVSGVAVNHRADWNPSFIITQETTQLGTLNPNGPASPEFAAQVLAELGLEGPVRGTFRPDPESVQIFLQGSTVSVDLTNGEATYEQVKDRFECEYLGSSKVKGKAKEVGAYRVHARTSPSVSEGS